MNQEHGEMRRKLAAALLLSLSVSSAQAAATADADFIINDDGTATHKTTGLTWKRCAEGQKWTGSTCSGTARPYQWYWAMKLGSDGWAVPTLAQLKTLVDRNVGSPKINHTIFPNTESASFWSTTAYAGHPGYVLCIHFIFGWGNATNTSDTSLVRLVRGGQSTATTRDPDTSFPPSDADHIFDYLETQYPLYLAPAMVITEADSGYEYRYYGTTQSYIGARNGKLYYLGPASGNALLELGTVSDWLATASKAGY